MAGIQDRQPLESKVRSIIDLAEPTTHRKLKQFMSAVQHMKKHIKNLATLCASFRSLLCKDNKFKWTETHSTAYRLLKLEIAKITTNHHFDQRLPIRLICNVSLEEGLGACLQQKHPDEGWYTIANASRFSTNVNNAIR